MNRADRILTAEDRKPGAAGIPPDQSNVNGAVMTDYTRYFSAGDMARIACRDCEGCGECCRGMGDTVVLDPYDAYQLAYGLGKPFAGLIGSEAELHAENGIVLPHLAMKGSPPACSFLGEDGRCRIHAFRPGICRLYPLARKYTGDGVKYFILPDACKGRALSKIRIRSWLGIPDLSDYERFKSDWFRFLSAAEEAALKEENENARKEISLFVLETFYLKPYDGDSFYTLAENRMKRAGRLLGIA